MIICDNNTVLAKSDFWSKTRQPAPVSPTRGHAPALRVRGFVSRKRVQEVWEKKRKNGNKIIIIINKKLTGKINMNKKEENKHNIT